MTEAETIANAVNEMLRQMAVDRDRIEQLEAALHRISLGSQDSGTTKEALGREARAAIGEK
jgi:hypothetical protein